MMLKKSMLILGGLVVAAGAAMAPHAAQARVFVGFGFSPFYFPAPYYYGPPPVVYVPPPMAYAPPPVMYIAPPQQSYYYCDNPKGYYPSVQSCANGWRQVPATPPAAR